MEYDYEGFALFNYAYYGEAFIWLPANHSTVEVAIGDVKAVLANNGITEVPEMRFSILFL